MEWASSLPTLWNGHKIINLQMGKLRLRKAPTSLSFTRNPGPCLLLGILAHCSMLTLILAFVFLIPERRGDVYHGLKFILFLCFPIIDSNSSYRRPAEGKHVLLTQPSTSSRRHSGGGPQLWGKRGVTFPLVILFFPSPCPRTTKHVFLFLQRKLELSYWLLVA